MPGENTFYIQNDDTEDITVPVSDTSYAVWKEIHDLVFDATSNGIQLNATLDAEGTKLGFMNLEFFCWNYTRFYDTSFTLRIRILVPISFCDSQYLE